MNTITMLGWPHTLLICLLALCSTALADGQRISDAGRRAVSPEIAVGVDGAINVIWLDKGMTADRPPPKPHKHGEHSHRSWTDLYFTRSEDGGKTWRTPVMINEQPGEIWGFSVSKPRIEVGPGGTLHVFYPANDRSAAIGMDIVSARYRRSTDQGKSFSAPITINSPSGKDRSDVLGEGLAMANSFGTMGVAPDGTIITAWQNVLDMQNSGDGADGIVAVSTDDGVSFSAERIVLPGNDVCPCCQLTLAFNDDTIYMGFRKIFDKWRDSVIARSTDGGNSFSVGGRLDLAPWELQGCPLKPTELGSDGERLYASTYTGGEDPAGLYFTVSGDGGKTFAGKQQVHPAAAYADAPALTVDPQGIVRLVWHAKLGGPHRLFTALSVDQGASLSTPVEIATPEGKSTYPATAVATDGTVYVAWQQANEEVFITTLLPPASMADQ
ncbi:MAG: sialidase family protein [Gammaproteobacteria bacterium]|nr:hypothetical protein [Chromatiales bacterium]MCP4926268.1 exo-alpha-sialidase [Gammaproteobacteria bacterium]MDP7296840.1 sialidase family protein [Gammaproteobacteria bacterium]MDP7419433.1 sialidase family protein [Gammaproteobacteria bacterium]MDP7660187.1 sialidase family protein [Gammaproteobacteria bacterium]